MSNGTNPLQPMTASGRSPRELINEVTELVPRLVRDELKLAQAEMTHKGKQAGVGAGMLGGSSLIALYGIACLLACAIAAISLKLPVWLAALIVGAAVQAVAAATALLGRSRLRKTKPPVPQEAIGSVKADIHEVKARARR